MTDVDRASGAPTIDRRVRMAAARLVPALCLMPLLALVVDVAAALSAGLGLVSVLPTCALFGAGIVACLLYARRTLLRPVGWDTAATVMGCLSGLVGGPAAGLSLSWTTGSPYGVVAGMVAGLALGYVVPRTLARRARAALLGPYDQALADSPVEVPFFARGDRRLVLVAGPAMVLLRGDYGKATFFRYRRDVRTVRSVSVTTLPSDERVTMAGVRRPVRVRLRAGEAVRLQFDDDAWTLPTDLAAQAAALLRRRSC